MRFGPVWMSPAFALLVACVPLRPAAAPPAPLSSASTPPAAAPPAPARTAAVDPGWAEFETRVLPILQGKCSPCHFPGGRMYDRLPFDRPGTIRVLGTALFTRLHDEDDREAIRIFLGVPSGSLPTPP